jgi:hypothetical protein
LHVVNPGLRQSHRDTREIANTAVDKGMTGGRAVRQRRANLLGSMLEDVAKKSLSMPRVAFQSIHSMRGLMAKKAKKAKAAKATKKTAKKTKKAAKKK